MPRVKAFKYGKHVDHANATEQATTAEVALMPVDILVYALRALGIPWPILVYQRYDNVRHRR